MFSETQIWEGWEYMERNFWGDSTCQKCRFDLLDVDFIHWIFLKTWMVTRAHTAGASLHTPHISLTPPSLSMPTKIFWLEAAEDLLGSLEPLSPWK